MTEREADEIDPLLNRPEVIDWLGLSEPEIARRRARRTAPDRQAAESSKNTIEPDDSGD